VQPGWPTNWERFNDFLPYENMMNQCVDCSTTRSTDDKEHSKKCRKGIQSPIDLPRNITASQPCRDRHRMNYVKGSCRFDTLDFEVLPHVLRVYQPRRNDCNVAPNIDFSLGYPVPWLLEFTDISVPSQHTQDGHRYDAEVILSHTYSTSNASDRFIGNVAVFLEKGTEEDHYDFLELYLRAWRESVAKVYKTCKSRRRHDRDLQSVSLEREEDFWSEDFDHGDDEWESVKEEWELLLEDDEGVDDPQEVSSSLRSEGRRDLRRIILPKAAPGIASPSPSPLLTSSPTLVPEFIDKTWYQGPWHPYDWYVCKELPHRQ
jgi:hypothetical protein